MKKVFIANKKWNNAMYFALLNGWLAIIGLFILGFYVKNLPLWATLTWGALFLFLFSFFVKELLKWPIEIEINSTSIVLHLPINRTKEYKLDEVRYYATASLGARAGYYHSVVLEFTDGERFQIPSLRIVGYNDFLQFLRNGNFDFFGFIGQNNWRRKHKALSTKWVIPRYEKELEDEIGKNNGLFILYFAGVVLFFMNVSMVYAFIFTV